MVKRLVWLAYEHASRSAVRAVERIEGIDTVGPGRRDPARQDAAGNVSYQSSSWRMLRRALPRGSVDGDDVFIDLGSGMGRVIYQAAKHYPLRRVVGVERSRELNEVARRNVARNLHRLTCRDVQIVTADIRSYEIPDDATIVYLFNPFVGDLFQDAIRGLLASYDRRPRQIRVLYANPVEHARVMGTGRARLVARRRPAWRPTRGWRDADTVHEYELGPVEPEARA